MEVFGRDINFKLTVGAAAKISEMCPDGDLTKIDQLLEGTHSNTLHVAAKLVCALNEGYEHWARFNGDPKIEPHEPVTEDMLMSLDNETFMELQREAIAAFKLGNKVTVEVEPEKKSKSRSKNSKGEAQVQS